MYGGHHTRCILARFCTMLMVVYRGIIAVVARLCIPHYANCAGRPPFRARNREDTEDFFLTALAKWHETQGLGKVILLGHSLGGYLAAQYALAHPEHVQHLVLVSPAGVVRAASAAGQPMPA